MSQKEKMLEGKVALITGGASGIGRASALLFAKNGAKISIFDCHREKGNQVVDLILKEGGEAIFTQGDASRGKDCERVYEKTVKKFQRVDILLNCAGIIHRATVLKTDEQDWERVLKVNLKSVFLMAKLVIPGMAERGGGVIINVSSGWGLVGGPKAAAYCAAKGAVVQLTRAMAIDHGHQKIRVNCLCPGDTDTQLLKEEARQLGSSFAHFLKEAARRPLRRIGTPEEIAQAALFLASDASSFITGASLVVDGGGLAGSF